ncbi:MAG TPA: TIGR03085 family metal-binding protein [Microthrixaceae bacterium]|nr:TIGR03085 family metal-binding protein [Microthrixaceae bacterium]
MSENYAQAERAALCDVFLDVGPDAPTLCEGWTTRDLATHLIVRERRFDAAVGIVLPIGKEHAARVTREISARPWADLVQTVRTGPPKWSPLGLFDRLANTTEYFIHHEDVRRAQAEWEPRELTREHDDELWRILRRMSKLFLRKSPTGVTLATRAGARATAKEAQPNVVVTGAPGELTMFVSGRQSHARVDLEGPPDAVDALRAASFGV